MYVYVVNGDGEPPELFATLEAAKGAAQACGRRIDVYRPSLADPARLERTVTYTLGGGDAEVWLRILNLPDGEVVDEAEFSRFIREAGAQVRRVIVAKDRDGLCVGWGYALVDADGVDPVTHALDVTPFRGHALIVRP